MTFSDFQKEAGKLQNHEHHVFRGQANAKWPLVTCYARFYKKTKGSSPFSLDLFKQMLTQFLNRISEYQGKDCFEMHEHQQIALAQHYGLPTPFLDWSRSPYIALYFAAADKVLKNEEGQIAVYSLNIRNLEKSNQIYKPDSEGLLNNNKIAFNFIETSNFYSKRISNQQGCFTFHNFPKDLFTSLKNDNPIVRYTIEDDPLMILKNLSLMGINSCNLFDDIDYISKDIIINSILSNS